jgi:hypothetical protein
MVVGIVLGVLIGSLGVLAFHSVPVSQPVILTATTVIRITDTVTVHEQTTQCVTTQAATTEGQKWTSGDAGVVSWEDAEKYVGQVKTVEGVIVRTYRSANAIFLDFHDPYQGYFMVVIFKSDWGNFKCQPEVFYKNKEVRVTGMIKTYQGSPEIVASSPTRIEVAYMGFPCQ